MRADPLASSLSVSRTSRTREQHEELKEEKVNVKRTTEARHTGNPSRSAEPIWIHALRLLLWGEKDSRLVQLLFHPKTQTFCVCLGTETLHFNTFACRGYDPSQSMFASVLENFRSCMRDSAICTKELIRSSLSYSQVLQHKGSLHTWITM